MTANFRVANIPLCDCASRSLVVAHPVVEAFRKEWPPAFAGPLLDKLSGNACRWSTTQNRRCRGEIPAGCFVEGRPTIVLRDPFLDWLDRRLAATLETNRPSDSPARRGRPRSPDRSANIATSARLAGRAVPKHVAPGAMAGHAQGWGEPSFARQNPVSGTQVSAPTPSRRG